MTYALRLRSANKLLKCANNIHEAIVDLAILIFLLIVEDVLTQKVQSCG